MKRLLPILVLLGVLPAHGAIAHKHDDGGACSGSTITGNMGTGSCTGSTVTKTFTYTANATGQDVIFMLSCAATVATPSAVSLAASGWTTNQVNGIIGNTTIGWTAVFRAYAPNTTLATFTETWTVSGGGCNSFIADLVGEFSGGDATNFVDASNNSGSSTISGCNSLTVTPVASNDGIWFACNDTVTAATSPYTLGGTDGASDGAEWKIISGTGTQTAAYTTSGNASGWGVAIKPASGGACTPRLMLAHAGGPC